MSEGAHGSLVIKYVYYDEVAMCTTLAIFTGSKEMGMHPHPANPDIKNRDSSQ